MNTTYIIIIGIIAAVLLGKSPFYGEVYGSLAILWFVVVMILVSITAISKKNKDEYRVCLIFMLFLLFFGFVMWGVTLSFRHFLFQLPL